ncbi:peptidylprolyl isomerase SurA [Corallincola spongiicola]|uniref:Chaperone SurA n=1 Tax=Corallincola spongiicola TaxID=2520508 RepID=A0ABY1WND8_9GAMM|nr:peptidylprolyl isomerase SurA [Corallincola spongiicola]TAA45073.1 peptidylprolyl isomerase SurA [Corallincola spongiicola]
MKLLSLKQIVLLITSLCWLAQANAEPQLLDKVIAIVNEGVVLQSEMDDMVADIKQGAAAAGQELPSDHALKIQVLDRLIMTSLQLQLAERMGMQIADSQLQQTLENIAKDDGLTLTEFRAKLESSGKSYEQFRNQVREELITGDVRRINVRRRINVSPQEIDSLVRQMNQEGAKDVEYHVGHIMIGVSNEADSKEMTAAEEKANKVLKLLDDGADFKRTAIASSAGPKALEGGDWGWMNINEMPTLFSEIVSEAAKGEIIGPIRTSRGFHLVKIFDMRGVEVIEVEEINSRHILIKPSIILSDEKAEDMLDKFAKELRADDSKFAELASKYSDDPGSAANGGELGWSDPNIYVPAFQRALSELQPGQISDAFRTQHGWHIVQLVDRRISDATEERAKEKAYQLIFNRKFIEQQGIWLGEIRAEAYIEILDEDIQG